MSVERLWKREEQLGMLTKCCICMLQCMEQSDLSSWFLHWCFFFYPSCFYMIRLEMFSDDAWIMQRDCINRLEREYLGMGWI